MRRFPALPTALFVSLALTSLLASGCGQKKGPRGAARPETIAMVGGKAVTLDEFMGWAKRALSDEPSKSSPRVLSSLLDQYLEEVLLTAAVDGAQPPVPGDTPKEKRRAFLSLRAGLDTLQDQDLKRQYDAHPERYRKPALVRVSQLLFPTKDGADAAMKRLAQGASWVDVSRVSSIAPNAESGGSLGLLGRADLPREFEKVVWSLPAGGTSRPLATPHGFHVFRVDERLDARDVTFEEAKLALRMAVAEERSAKAAEDVVAEARRRFPVVIVEEHLPFPYVGANARGGDSR